VIWLLAGRIGQSPDRQLDIVPELPVQFLGGRGSPGRQRDPERRDPAFVRLRHWVLHQDARLLIA